MGSSRRPAALYLTPIPSGSPSPAAPLTESDSIRTLDQYLGQFIEDYLFEDLRSIATFRGHLEERRPGRAAGYPMA